MMKDHEEIKMEIIIGDEPIQLIVPFQNQDLVRSLEDEINQLYSRWRMSFPKKTDKGLMAMIVYRYALKYREITLEMQRAAKLAENCIDMIDNSAHNDSGHP